MGLAGAEEPIAPRVLLQAHNLLLHARPSRRPDPCDLRAQEGEVQERERRHERGVDREGAPVVLAEREAPNGGLHHDHPRHHHAAGERSRERGDDGDEDVHGGGERTIEPPFEAQERRVQADRQERANLDVHEEGRFPGHAQLRVQPGGQEQTPDDERRSLPDPERTHGPAGDNERAEGEGEGDAVPAAEGATEEQGASHERVHRHPLRYQLAIGAGKFAGCRDKTRLFGPG